MKYQHNLGFMTTLNGQNTQFYTIFYSERKNPIRSEVRRAVDECLKKTYGDNFPPTTFTINSLISLIDG